MSIGTINGQTPPLDKYLKLEGGTMTGPLVLSGNPKSNLEAASKQYVDSKLTGYVKGWELIATSSRADLNQLSGILKTNVKFNNLNNISQYKELYFNYEVHISFRTGELGSSTTYKPRFSALNEYAIVASYTLGPNQTINNFCNEKAFVTSIIVRNNGVELITPNFTTLIDNSGYTDINVSVNADALNSHPLASNSSYGIAHLYGRK